MQDPASSTSPSLLFVDYEARESCGAPVEVYTAKHDAIRSASVRGNLPVWSIDLDVAGGSKYFVVASYAVFWKHYEGLPRPERGSPDWAQPFRPTARKRGTRVRLAGNPVQPFAYETILQGVPCHLFLDMDAYKPSNAGVDLEGLAARLLDLLAGFARRLGVVRDATGHAFDVVTMDSSTGTKFSRHMVCKLADGAMFDNVNVCGSFIRNFHAWVVHTFGADPASNPFYVSKPDGGWVFLIDLRVYTKTRDFRILGSCKREKSDQPVPLRWLWLSGRPRELTLAGWLGTLVMRPSGGRPARLVLCVPDTRADGIPMSSSLATLRPISEPRAPRSRATGGARFLARGSAVSAKVAVDERARRDLVVRVLPKIVHWLHSTADEPFATIMRHGRCLLQRSKLLVLADGNWAFCIDTSSHYCVIKRDKHGTAMHGSRTVGLIVWVTGWEPETRSFSAHKFGAIKAHCLSQRCVPPGRNTARSRHYLGNGLPDELRSELMRAVGLTQNDLTILSEDVCMFIE